MEKNANPRSFRRILWLCGIVVATFGIFNFACALVAWGFSLYIAMSGKLGQVDWSCFWSAAPAPILFAVFLCSILLRKRRVFGVLLCAGILISGAWSVYDAWCDNYQIQMMTLDKGCMHSYFNWLWMSGQNDQVVQRVLGPAPRWRSRAVPRSPTLESNSFDGNALPE